MMSDSDESGFSTKETTLYMWQMETFAWSLRGMQCSLYFLFSSLFVSFPNLHFQLRALTSALQPPVTVLGLPLPFEIIYWSGAVDYLFFFSRLISFLRLFAFVFFFHSLSFMMWTRIT